MQLKVERCNLVLEDPTMVKPEHRVHLDYVHRDGFVRHVDQDTTMPTVLKEMSVRKLLHRTSR